VLTPLISKEDTKRTTITRKIIKSSVSRIITSSLRPIIIPISQRMNDEPFHNECPTIAIRRPKMIDLGGIIFNLCTELDPSVSFPGTIIDLLL
jgi:hypothetical protein